MRTLKIKIVLVVGIIGLVFFIYPTAHAAVGNLKYVGYYWAFSSAYGDYLDEVAPYTNVIGLQAHENNAFQMAQRAKAKGMKIILDVQTILLGGSSLSPDYQTRWNIYKPIVQQIVDLGNVYTFYMDEPMCRWPLADVQTVINLMKRDFPTVKNMITENAFCQYPISGPDIYSVDLYSPPFNYANDIYGTYDYLKNIFSGEIWVTAQAFQCTSGWPFGDPTIDMEASWFNLAKSDPRYVGLYWFLYPNVPGTAPLLGAVSYPDVVAYNRQVGLQVLCSNNWENNPVCGANGVSYANPDLAKCAGTTIAKYGTCGPTTKTGDFNGDGFADILWLDSTTGQVNIRLLNNTSVINQGSPGSIAANPNWLIKSVDDFNGDGRTDILWHDRVSGQVYIWFINGTSKISEGSVISTHDINWQIKGTDDFNGDNKADILWQHTNGQVVIWLINGLSVVSSGVVAATVDSSWQIKGVGDFNGDNKADILWQQAAGQVGIWLVDGLSAVFAGNISTPVPLDWQIKDVGDFNGNNKDDILWLSTSGQVAIWLIDGTNAVVGNPGYASGAWQISGVGDFNRDNKADILWANNGNITVGMDFWLMDGINKLSTDTISPGAPVNVSVH